MDCNVDIVLCNGTNTFAVVYDSQKLFLYLRVIEVVVVD